MAFLLRLFRLAFYTLDSLFVSCPSGANEDIQVVLGGVDVDKEEASDQTIPVIRTIIHEHYRDTRVAVYNDIGLSHLSNVLPLRNHVDIT